MHKNEKWIKLIGTILCPDEMYTVEKWVNLSTGRIHFRRRFVDTLTNSITVAQGKLERYYGYIYENSVR